MNGRRNGAPSEFSRVLPRGARGVAWPGSRGGPPASLSCVTGATQTQICGRGLPRRLRASRGESGAVSRPFGLQPAGSLVLGR